MMRRVPRPVGRARIEKQVGGQRIGGGRELKGSRRPGAIVDIFIPFIAEGPAWKCVSGVRRERGNRRIAPEPHFAVSRGNLDGKTSVVVSSRTIHHEQRSGQLVLRPSAVRW